MKSIKTDEGKLVSQNTLKEQASAPRLALFLASLMTLTLLFTSCGDSENSGTDSASLTKAQFIKQADKICAEADEKLVIDYRAFVKSHGIKGRPSKPQSLEVAEEIYLPNIENRLEDLQKLSPPVGDEDQVKKIFAATEDAIAVASKNPEATLGKSPFEKSKALTTAYGFTACGEV
jgi:hypothetical protein